MRISDWSSDVCSSDLDAAPIRKGPITIPANGRRRQRRLSEVARLWCADRRKGRRERDLVDAVARQGDRKGGVEGKGGSVRVGLGGRRILTQKKMKGNCDIVDWWNSNKSEKIIV